MESVSNNVFNNTNDDYVEPVVASTEVEQISHLSPELNELFEEMKSDDSRDWNYLEEHLYNQDPALHNEIAKNLIEIGDARLVINNLDKYVGLDVLGFVEVLAFEAHTSGKEDLRNLCDVIASYPQLDADAVANILINSGWGDLVAEYASEFRGLADKTYDKISHLI